MTKSKNLVVRPQRKRSAAPALPKLTLKLTDKPKAAATAVADAKAWASIRDHIEELFPLTKGGTAGGDLTKALLRIETGFTFHAQPQDEDFSELHVEPLVDQAADLLDRGVRDRAAYDDLAARTMTLSLEINEFAELDQIRASEQLHGCYSVAFKESRAEWLAGASASAGYDYAAEYAKDTRLYFYHGAEAKDAVKQAKHAGWLTGQTPTKNIYYSGYGLTSTVAVHAEQVAALQTTRQLEIDDASMFLHERQAATAGEVAGYRVPGLEARAVWNYANQHFAKWRTDVERKYNLITATAATAPNGVLNCGKRLDSTRDRFQVDFRNALARLVKVESGMRLLYGYDVPLPANYHDINYFDDCLLWARQAIDWLVRFARREQTFVWPVSLRQQLGDDVWAEGLGKRTWSFVLDPMSLPGFTHVRLRGLSAVTVSDDSKGAILWGMAVQAPASGTVVHMSGQKRTIDQTRIPSCELGRVTTRVAIRQPDVLGATALYNASPFGEWKVFLKSSTWPKQGQHDVEDIQLELTLAFRRVLSNVEPQ